MINFRPRIQGGQGRPLQGAVPPALRVRRPGARGGKFQTQGLPTTLTTGDQFISRSTPSPIGPTPPLPAILAQARPLPPETPLPPRPIQEDPIEDDLPEELETEPQPLPIPTSTPLPTSLSTRPQHLQPAILRPQNLQPAVIRPSRPAFRPERPLVPNAVPVEEVQIPIRHQFRQPIDDIPVRKQYQQPAEENIPTRQQFRQQQPRPTPPAEPQYQRQPQQVNTRQQQVVRQPPPQHQYKSQRPKKPVAQVIRKYREDNADGSITWGYENDDGSFKEETIGVNCVVQGKYGYTDPDGLRREYTYSSGIPCDKEEEERRKQSKEGFVDYQNNQYVLPNGDAIDLESVIKNKARRPVAAYRN
ncbi:hypothetical protein C0J52_04080 [Blattella germanica]|nr:hypothetical protein C0J52_04080 [Blattella germanica]